MFKVGDKVKVNSPGSYYHGKTAVITSYYPDKNSYYTLVDAGEFSEGAEFPSTNLECFPKKELGSDIFDNLNPLIKQAGEDSVQWWQDLETGEPKERNIAEVLCLIHSEISEAMEGYRKNLMDDKLPHRQMIEVELADACIRIFDLCYQKGYDLPGAIKEKMEYNRHREDHKRENRLKENGKKF